MNCPICNSATRVLDTRSEPKCVSRRRKCVLPACGKVLKTEETFLAFATKGEIKAAPAGFVHADVNALLLAWERSNIKRKRDLMFQAGITACNILPAMFRGERIRRHHLENVARVLNTTIDELMDKEK